MTGIQILPTDPMHWSDSDPYHRGPSLLRVDLQISSVPLAHFENDQWKYDQTQQDEHFRDSVATSALLLRVCAGPFVMLLLFQDLRFSWHGVKGRAKASFRDSTLGVNVSI